MPPISRKQHILDSLSMNDLSSDNSCSNLSLHSSDSRVPSCDLRSDLASRPGDSAAVLLEQHAAQYARVNRVILDKNSDEYRKRRERNNIAVKKSR